MTDTKFTPGPWISDSDHPNTWHPNIRSTVDSNIFAGNICTVLSNLIYPGNDPKMHIEMKANAHLIAAGCLMSDEEAAAIPEEQSWESLVFQGLVTTSKHKHLIGALQDVHDIQPVAEWPDSLRELADEEGLVYSHEN